MEFLNKFDIKEEREGTTLYLYIKGPDSEFSNELGIENNKKSVENAVQEYIETHFSDVKAKVVKLIMGGLTVSTIGLGGAPTFAKVPEESTKQTSSKSSYVVQSGDTLWKLAASNGTTIDAIKNANGLTSDVLLIGRTLVIPGKTLAPDVPPATNPQPFRTVTVVAGDTLSLLAKKNNTTVDAIKQSSNLSSDLIKIGQTLKIPSSAAAGAGTSTSGSTASADTTAGSGTSVSPSAGSPEPASDPVVVSLQNDLKSLGYYAVPAMTGTNDPTTLKAINSFQKDYGLPVTGVADQSTRTEISHAVVKQGLVKDTAKYTGVPYVWGGTTPAGFDCSGFVYYMFNSHGVNMARSNCDSLFKMGKSIERSQLKPGDLVFFGVNTPGKVSHVGFYLGDNQYISATNTKGIWVYSLDNPYWSKYYLGAKRVY